MNSLETDHDYNNPKCDICWSSYPKECSCGQGLLHAEFGDEMENGYYLNYGCSNPKCNEYYGDD